MQIMYLEHIGIYTNRIKPTMRVYQQTGAYAGGGSNTPPPLDPVCLFVFVRLFARREVGHVRGYPYTPTPCQEN